MYHSNLKINGRFCSKNLIFGEFIKIIETPEGFLTNGKIQNINVFFPNSNFTGDFDLLFFSDYIENLKMCSPFSPDNEIMKKCFTRASICSGDNSGSDYISVAGGTMATLYNLNIPFLLNKLGCLLIYQSDFSANFSEKEVSIYFGIEKTGLTKI